VPRPWCIPNNAKSKASNPLLKTLVRDYKLDENSKELLELEPLLDIMYNGFDANRFGLHNLVYTALATILPGRQDAVSNLRLVYTIENDKVVTDRASDVQIA
jgi:hypothetical protein